MIDLKCKMFEESRKSTAPESAVRNTLLFIIILLIAMLAEAIIPTVAMYPELQNRLAEAGAANDFGKSMEISKQLSGETKNMIISLYCTSFATLVAIIYCRFSEARHLSSMGLRKEKASLHYLQGLGTGIAMISAVALMYIVTGVGRISTCTNINFGILGLYLGGFILQGMSEEVIFRGFYMNTLGAHSKPVVAILLSALAFNFAHCFNTGYGLVPAVNLTLFGVFMSVYMIAFDDIWGVCAIHSIWNFFQGCFYGISVSGTSNTESVFRITNVSTVDFLNGGHFGAEGSIFTTITLAAAISLVLMKIKKQNAP